MSECPVSHHLRRFAHCLPFGAQPIGPQRTRFRFWAPSRSRVQLAIEGRAPLDMTHTGQGWFEAEAEGGAGTRYQYRLDDNLAVPDPASRFQPEGVHGPSQVIDPKAYEWQHPSWQGRPWEETVLYELHVGAFGAGQGYRGVQARLPELAALGITALELMPLAAFPGTRNWGYDGVLPFAPDAAYGTPDELKAMIDTAHGLGLMVFLDVVYNHFGPDGNYLHTYAEAFFKQGVDTPWGPAIDFEQPEVREFFFNNAIYWLREYRFDGLRLDAVHAIGDDPWLCQLAEHVRGAIEHGRHVHLVLENENNTASLLKRDFTAQWNDDAHNALHVLLTGETESYYGAYAEQPIRKLARVLSEGFAYQGEPSPIHAGKPRGEPSAELPPTAFVMFLQNHDQVGNRAFGERLRALCEPAALRAATALLLLSPQIPLLFMGEEWGATQPFLFFTDYTGELAEAVRDGRRKEFAKFSAFSDAKRRAAIPDPNQERTFKASWPSRRPGAANDQSDWLGFYQAALRVRAEKIVPFLSGAKTQGVTLLAGSDGQDVPALLARWRLGGGTTLTIALNLGGTPVDLPAPDAQQHVAAELIFDAPHGAFASGTPTSLPGFSLGAWISAPHAAQARS
jgi:maltooligosyltrehalose trehalohydrolase